MHSENTQLFAALLAPFMDGEVRERNKGGQVLHYVTARVIMNRLDEVLGPENWWDEYVPGENSVLCKLTVRLPDGSHLMKCDAGGMQGMSDAGDDDKSAYSDALKRAAAKFGVGRYLYGDGVPSFARDQFEAPEPEPAPAPAPRREARRDAAHAPSADPTSGKALYGWLKDLDKRFPGVMEMVTRWGGHLGFPGRVVDWNRDEVAQAVGEARRISEVLSRSNKAVA